jgi:succinate dehydrogenase / fumarate reductase cytochrome b subunit
MTETPHRPLSPFVSVWRWHITMVASILHRVSGVGLAVGMLLVVAWLVCLKAGPEAYAGFAGVSGSWLGLIVWIGVSWSAFYHLASGIRHLIWDTGLGFSLGTANALSWASIGFSVGGTAVFWFLLMRAGVL